MIAKLGNRANSMNSRDSRKSDCCESGAEKKLVGYNDDTAYCKVAKRFQIIAAGPHLPPGEHRVPLWRPGRGTHADKRTHHEVRLQIQKRQPPSGCTL